MLPDSIVRNVSPAAPAALPLPVCPACKGAGRLPDASPCDCLGSGVDPVSWAAHQEWKTDFIRRYGRSS